MKKQTEFAQFIVEDVLGEIPGIVSKAMFGGYGIYKDGIIFAIIADKQLYFKVDDRSETKFKQWGSKPFIYQMPTGKKIAMNYWLLPEDIMESQESILQWVREAVAASKRGKEAKKKK